MSYQITTSNAQFLTAYQQDRSLFHFHYHHPAELLIRLQDLALPRREFSSQMAAAPQLKGFITEDEINAVLAGGSSISGGKSRIYAYFSEAHTPKEKADFLKNEYGWGGHAPAISDVWHSSENHDGKGKLRGCPTELKCCCKTAG